MATKKAAKRASKKSAAGKTTAAKKTAARQAGAKPRLLSDGNPQVPKGDGNAPVKAYIAAMPGWKQAVGKRLDRLIARAAPGVRKAVKWNSPFYGAKGDEGWFLNFHCFERYIKVAFFKGDSLDPPPPIPSKHAHVRYLHIPQGNEFDREQFTEWVKQANELPGERV